MKHALIVLAISMLVVLIGCSDHSFSKSVSSKAGISVANNQLLASDNWVGGSLAAGWSSMFGLSKCQVVSGTPNVTEPAALSAEAGQIWTGLTWPGDQTSEASVNLTSEATSDIRLLVRWQTGSLSGYKLVVGSNVATLYRFDNNVSTQLGQATGLTLANGDLWSLTIAGSVLHVYQNYSRVLYAADTTYTSGAPGFAQFSSSNITHTQVLSWRGYNGIQQDGIWQKQGIIIPLKASDIASSGYGIFDIANVIRETNAQLLSGLVYKMWFIGGGINVGNPISTFYAESVDGINWTRRSTALISNFGGSALVKVAGTYYLYGQVGTGFGGASNIQVYTSSDGINWTLQNSAAIVPGTSGQWDAGNLYLQCNPVISNGTWYAFYTGAPSPNTPINFATGIATSPDGINWTKYGSNPVIPSTTPGPLNFVNGTYYMWPARGPGSTNLQLAGNAFDPTETVRFSSTNLTTWTGPVHSLHHTQLNESVNNPNGGSTACIVMDVGGKAYMYYVTAPSDGNAPQFYQISLAIAPTVVANVVQFNEDAVQQLATDNFTRANGGLGSNWATPTGGTALQIASNKAEATTLGAYNAQYFNATAFSNDQYSEMTLATMVTSSYIAPAVRIQSGANSMYAGQITGTPGGGISNNATIVKVTAGTGVAIGPSVPCSVAIGDVFRVSIIGNVISFFQNNQLLLQVEDIANSFPTGNPGAAFFAATSVANVQANNWNGGNANVIPAYPAVIGSSDSGGAGVPGAAGAAAGVTLFGLMGGR